MALPKFEVLAHIQNHGDRRGGPGEFVGTRGESKRMEAFSITFDSPPDGIGLRYYAHIAHHGATRWVTDGHLVGERGKELNIQGFAIELSGPKLAEYDVRYMTHVEQSGDTAWVANGTLAGTNGRTVRRAEGIAVTIAPRKAQHVVLVSKTRSGSGRPLVITASERADDTAVYVSVADGNDLHVWDRRPVKGGQGFALINKARPDRCLARGPGVPAMLRDVSRIDTDDDCVWLDGRATGAAYYPITSWSARNLRLRVGGARPYPDRDNELLVFPFTHDTVDHELWVESDESYAAVAGTDDKALNVLSEAIHRGCHEEVFKGSFLIRQLGIESVDYDMTQAPRFAIYDPASITDPLLRRLMELLLGIADGAPYLVAHVERVTLAVTMQNGERYATDTSILLGAVVRFNPDRSLTLRFGVGLVSFPPSLIVEGALNLVFIPLLRDHLNENVLDQIRIPPLRLFDVEFAAPALATRFPHVLAATALPPDLSELPPATRWPADKVFLGVDAPALGAVAKAALERLEIHDKWEYNKALEVCHLHLEAHYDVTFHNPRFLLMPSGGNRYTVQIDLGGSASFQFRCGIFHWTPTARASGSATATADVSIDARNHVIVTFRSLDAFTMSWHLSGIPHWILEREMELILDAFVPVAAHAVGLKLRGHAFDVYAIPTIRPRIAGKTFEITLRELALGAMADGDGTPLVLATGTASVTTP